MSTDRFWRNEIERENYHATFEMLDEFPILEVYQPNPDSAPWHWRIGHGSDSLNLWPHLIKANREGYRGVTGLESVRQLVVSYIEAQDREDPDDLVLIEEVVRQPPSYRDY